MTEEQCNRVRIMLHGSRRLAGDREWDDPDAEEDRYDPSERAQLFREQLKAVEGPEELHQFALNYNWDDGPEYLKQVIDSSHCDQGTALLLFWLADPTRFYQPLNTIKEWEIEEHRLVAKIESKYLNQGFRNHSIHVDPKNIFGVDYLRDCGGEPGYDRIPAELKKESPGVVIDRLDL